MPVNALYAAATLSVGSSFRNENRLARTFLWEVTDGYGYIHNIYGWGSPLPPCAANYVFVRRISDGRAFPLYIGETDNLARRFVEHHTDAYKHAIEAQSLGASEVHAFVAAISKAERERIETQLRTRWNPPVNRQGINKLMANKLLALSSY